MNCKSENRAGVIRYPAREEVDDALLALLLAYYLYHLKEYAYSVLEFLRNKLFQGKLTQDDMEELIGKFPCNIKHDELLKWAAIRNGIEIGNKSSHELIVEVEKFLIEKGVFDL